VRSGAGAGAAYRISALRAGGWTCPVREPPGKSGGFVLVEYGRGNRRDRGYRQ